MLEFLRNWIQGIAMAVILASIFEMLLPNGNLKKYIKVVLGMFIIFSIITPFVNSKELYSFDISDEVEKFTSSNKSQIETQNNFQEMYVDAFEQKIVSIIEEQGYNVRSCLVDGIFEGNEDDIGISKIKIVLSSKNENYNKTSQEEGNVVSPVEKVIIKVETSKKYKIIEDKISSEDIEKLKKYLAESLSVNIKIIDIQNY